MIQDWVREYQEELNEEKIDASKVMADTELYIKDLSKHTRWFYSNFREILLDIT